MKVTLRTAAILLGTTALMLSPILPEMSVIGASAAYAKSERGEEMSEGKGGGQSEKEGSENSGNGGGKPEKAETEATSEPARGKSETGALASELKGLNAYHASAQARANAAPESKVGQIETYRLAVEASRTAAELIAGLQEAALQAALSRDGLALDLESLIAAYDQANTDIDDAIALLDPLSLSYADDVAALEALRPDAQEHDLAVLALQEQLDTAIAEATAAEEAAQFAAAAAEASELAEAEALLAAGGGDLSPEALAYLRLQLGL